MVRASLLLLVLLLLMTPLILEAMRTDPLPIVAGREVVFETEDLEVHFGRIGPHEDSYMLFGGVALEGRNAMPDVVLSGLALRHVTQLSHDQPDFLSCRSPAAEDTKRLLEPLGLVAESGAVRELLDIAIAQHERAVADGGERVCIRLRGEALSLDSIRDRARGLDVTEQVSRHFRQNDHYLVRDATVVECSSLL